MTRAAEILGTPRAHLRVPSHWPFGEIDDGIPARYAQRFSARLQEAIGTRSYRAIARESGVSHGTISALVRGDTWPDLITISKLEWALGRVLWPGQDLFLDELCELRSEHIAYLRAAGRRARMART